MTDTNETAPSLGQTGGLPGANAVPRASELTDDIAKDTVAAVGPATPTGVENPDPAYAGDDIDPAYDEPGSDTRATFPVDDGGGTPPHGDPAP